MTGETTSTHGHTTVRTASEAHGIGADIGALTGAGRHGGTRGSTDGATRGIMAAIGEDGTIRGIIGDTGDGMTHGTTVDIGACIIHGIRTTPDGTEDSARTGDIIILAEVRDMDTEDTSAATDGPVRDMRLRQTTGYLPAPERQLSDEASARAAAQAEVLSPEAVRHAAA